MGCIPFLVTTWTLLLIFAIRPAALDRSLEQLGLTRGAAALFYLAMVLLAGVSIPLLRRRSPRYLKADPLAVYGFEGLNPRWEGLRRSSTLAISLGGGVLPLCLAAAQTWRIAARPDPGRPLIALALAVGVCIAISWKLSRPLPALGVALPALAPALSAAAAALLLQGEAAAPFAAIAGVLGPIVGAGLLRVRDVARRPVAVHSLGGPGTFTAILAALTLALLVG